MGMSSSERRYRHSALGTGRVLESRRRGRELRFRADDTGLSYWVQANTLEMIPTVARRVPPPPEPAAESGAARPPTPVAPARVETSEPSRKPAHVRRAPKAPADPLEVRSSRARLSTRAALEALRLGVVPADGIQHFTVGLEAEQDLVKQSLASSRGSVRFFTAPYGSGKSHTLELASQLALSTGFAVAAAEMDRQEVTFRRPKRMYRALAQSLRLPNVTDEGMAALVSRLGPKSGPHAFGEWAEHVVEQDLHFLGTALVNYWRADPESFAREEIFSYMSGDQVPVGRLNSPSLLRDLRHGRFLSIPDWSTERGAVAMVHLVSDLARLVMMTGARGLLIVLDEGEHYRDLTFSMQYRADLLMQNLLGSIENGRIVRTHFMMAVTPTPDKEYPEWIAQRPLSEIADPTRVEVERYIHRFGELYVDAYPRSERPTDGVAGALARGLWDSNLDIGNMRMLTKSLVAAWDIVRMTPVSWKGLLAEWT